MRKGMIVTVGTGTGGGDIAAPLVGTIRNSHPDFVALLCSESSQEVAERVVSDLDRSPEEWMIQIVRNENDLESCFAAALGAFRALRARGIMPARVTADFTSGTKAMSAGLVLASVAERAGALCYIAGRREQGRVVSGTERFLSFRPNAVFAHQALDMATQFMEKFLFEAAANLLNEETVKLLDEEERAAARSLRSLAEAYQFRELFDHRAALGKAKEAGELPAELRRFAWDDRAAKRLHNLSREAGTAQTESRPPAPTLELVADLFCNAERRLAEGRYDDAVARLYRATEMLAQLRLKERFELDTGDIDTAKLPSSSLKKKYEGLRDRGRPREEGKIKLGLRKAYELLEDLGDPVGKEFPRMNRLQNALRARNDSLLAHGAAPVGKAEAKVLHDELEALARKALGDDFDAARNELRFPWKGGSDC